MCTVIKARSYSFAFRSFLCFMFHIRVFCKGQTFRFIAIKVELTVPLRCVCAILPVKAVLEMTYTVSGGMLNPTYSLTHCASVICCTVFRQ